MQVNTSDDTLIAKIIGLVIAVVIVGMVLVPFVTEATTTEKTFNNNGYYPLIKIDENTEATIVWDSSNPAAFTIDGTLIDFPTLGRLTILGSDSICMRYNTASNTHQVQVFGSYSGTQGYIAAAEASGHVMTLEISQGIVSVTVEDSLGAVQGTKTFDLGNDAYILAPNDTEADYVAVMKITTEKAYLLGDSEIIICGMSIANNQSGAIGVFGKGNMTDGMDFSTFYVGSSYSGDVTFTDVVAYSESVTGYVDLYTLEKYTATINYNDTSTEATYNYFIVPVEVTAELSQHPSNIEITLYQMIPILVVLGLIVAIVGMLAYNKYSN